MTPPFEVCRQDIEHGRVSLYDLPSVVNAFFGFPLKIATEHPLGLIQLPFQLWDCIAASRSYHCGFLNSNLTDANQ